jgi:DNA modification methylase
MPNQPDPRNKLNDLTGKEWLKLTKSYWFSEKTKNDKFAFQHPAPFLIRDIEKLISMFTKKNMVVLDPFNGLGATLIASHNLKRRGIGIDLSKDYCIMAKARLKALGIRDQKIIIGDSLKKISKLKGSIDYCVTSPPYHNILKNNGNGLRDKKKKDVRVGSRMGVSYYSEDARDLGNQNSYDDFLNLLEKIMLEVFKKLKEKKYCSIIISDFTVNKKETNASGDVIRIMNRIGFKFSGAISLLQENKPLYPFGYPFEYKINHHHQYILNFRKELI